MRKIGLPCFTRNAEATSLSAATASNLYSASISGTSYLRSRSEKIGSRLRLLVMIFLPISRGRYVSSKEGERHPPGVRDESYDALAPCERKLIRHGRTGGNNFLTDHTSGWLAAKRVHIFDKSAQFRKVLRDLWSGDEGPLPRRISTRPRLTRF